VSPYLSIFGFSVQAYLLLLMLAVWAGLWLAARQARWLGLDSDHVYNMGFYALLATLLGARLAYVLGNWPAYRDGPLAALSPTPTALAWPEGLVIGGLVAAVYWLRYHLPVGATLDALVPGLTLAMALERLGAFLDGRNFGEPTTLPWGVLMWGEVRHPVQLYEMLALLAILGLTWWQRQRRPFNGHAFVVFLALYAGSRLFLEAFRADAAPIAGGLRAVQVVALGVVLVAVGYLYRRRFPAGDGTLLSETD
jgi:phosphatidylglycerol:prolipoprotein diacylglycerol transferase